MPTCTIHWPNFNLRITFDYTPGDPGQTYGPPERCYEGWDHELEITEVIFIDAAGTKLDVTPFITSELCEDVMEKLVEEVDKWIEAQSQNDDREPDNFHDSD